MTNIELFFFLYTFFGILLIIFNKDISNVLYNLILYYTDKLKIKELFIFKVDESNRNSMFFLTRAFTVLFGLAIVSACLYFISM